MGSMTKQSASLPFSFFSKQCAKPCTLETFELMSRLFWDCQLRQIR